VDHRIALPDVFVELVQRLSAGGNEVLLHLDRDIWAFKIAAQGVAVAAELRANGRQKDLYARHCLFTLRYVSFCGRLHHSTFGAMG